MYEPGFNRYGKRPDLSSARDFAGVLELWPDLAKCEYQEQLNAWRKKLKAFEAWCLKPRSGPRINGVMERGLTFAFIHHSSTPPLQYSESFMPRMENRR